jgi:shikimate dehydrogenase
VYTNNTKIFGILGFPLGHTLSPMIHNHLFAYAKFDGVYLVFEKPDWPTRGLGALLEIGVQGLSVTIPFKEWAFQVADIACETSSAMKASNTLLLKSGTVEARNTDGYGAIRSIIEADPGLVSMKDESQILVLGSGGSAKGILYALVSQLQSTSASNSLIPNSKKPKIRILARNETAVNEIISSIKVGNLISPISLSECYAESKDFSLVIHTTPLGMKGIPGEPMLNKDFFNKHTTLFDIVYNPLQTELVKIAKKKKSRIIPGYSMLLYQGIKQFEYFTNIEVKRSWIQKIEKILLKKLKS